MTILLKTSYVEQVPRPIDGRKRRADIGSRQQPPGGQILVRLSERALIGWVSSYQRILSLCSLLACSC